MVAGTKKVRLKDCRRCGGDAFLNGDSDAWECLQCGHAEYINNRDRYSMYFEFKHGTHHVTDHRTGHSAKYVSSG